MDYKQIEKEFDKYVGKEFIIQGDKSMSDMAIHLIKSFYREKFREMLEGLKLIHPLKCVTVDFEQSCFCDTQAQEMDKKIDKLIEDLK